MVDVITTRQISRLRHITLKLAPSRSKSTVRLLALADGPSRNASCRGPRYSSRHLRHAGNAASTTADSTTSRYGKRGPESKSRKIQVPESIESTQSAVQDCPLYR